MLPEQQKTELDRLVGERGAEAIADDIKVPLTGFLSDELNGTSIDPYNENARPTIPVNDRANPPDGIRLEVIRRQTVDPKEDDVIDMSLIGQNSRSRVYLGVHWQFDATDGERAGLNVARRVLAAAYDLPPRT